MKRTLFALLVILIGPALSAQKGLTVIDSLSRSPLAGAHLRLLSSGVVFVSNSQGVFPFIVNPKSAVISHLGYQESEVAAIRLNQGDTLALIPQPAELEGVYLFPTDPRSLARKLIAHACCTDLPELYTIREVFRSDQEITRLFQGQVAVVRVNAGYNPFRKWSQQLRAYRHSLDYFWLKEDADRASRGFMPDTAMASLLFLNTALQDIAHTPLEWSPDTLETPSGYRRISFRTKPRSDGVVFNGTIVYPLDFKGIYYLRMGYLAPEGDRRHMSSESGDYALELTRSGQNVTVEFDGISARLRRMEYLEEGRVYLPTGIHSYSLDLSAIWHGEFRDALRRRNRLLPGIPWYRQFDGQKLSAPKWQLTTEEINIFEE